jgi:hypothetical protein
VWSQETKKPTNPRKPLAKALGIETSPQLPAWFIIAPENAAWQEP